MKTLTKCTKPLLIQNFLRLFCTNNKEIVPVTTINEAPLNLKNNPRIIIIGAGLAGLSAASHLIKNGLTNVKLLEASTRYGGRVHSVEFGDTLCELGAKWIAVDKDSNSLHHLVKQKFGENIMQDKIERHYIDSKGNIIQQNLINVALIAFKTLFCSTELHYKQKLSRIQNMQNVKSYFQSETEDIAQNVFRDNYQVSRDTFNVLMKECSGCLGCDLEYVHTEQLTKLCKMYYNSVYIPNGMQKLLEEIAKDIQVEKLILGKPVIEIHWGRFPTGVGSPSVLCADGTKYFADHIICTVPLGSLQTFAPFLFKPGLPKEKLQSLASLGFGSPSKLFLEYEEPYVKWFIGTINPVWNSSEIIDRSDWAKDVVEISQIPNSSKVLEVKIGGTSSEEIEAAKDEEIVTKVTNILRKFMNNSNIPPPTNIIRSQWGSDARYLGGKPYLSTFTKEEHINSLAKPLGSPPKLFFAGDATIWNGFGCLDGARNSGIREANGLLKLYNVSNIAQI